MTSNEKLRKKAGLATPGPWRDASGKGSAVVSSADCAIYLNVRTVEVDDCVARWQRDAAYIAAANPTAIIALLDRLEASEREVERLTNSQLAERAKELEKERDIARRRADERYQECEELRAHYGEPSQPLAMPIVLLKAERDSLAARLAVVEQENEALSKVYGVAASLRSFPVPFDSHYELVGAVDECRNELTKLLGKSEAG